jgi:hypothetical protein
MFHGFRLTATRVRGNSRSSSKVDSPRLAEFMRQSPMLTALFGGLVLQSS